MRGKRIKVILPNGESIDIQMENDLNITEYNDGKIFMLIDGIRIKEEIQDKRHLH